MYSMGSVRGIIKNMRNRLAFGMACFALMISLVRQPTVFSAAQLAGSSISNGAGSPGNTCGASNTFSPGSIYIQSSNGHIWTCWGTAWVDNTAAAVGVPAGLTAMVTSGSCPSGYTEVSALNANMPYGTIAANGDVGGTGGANSVTPTVATLTAAAQTFTGSSATTSSVSGGTPSGTNGSVTGPAQVISWPVGVPAFTGASGTVPAETFTGNAGTVPAETFTGTPFSSVINHTHTITVTSLVQGGTTAATTGTHIMTSVATGGSARAPVSGDSFTATSANPSGGVSSITPGGTNGTVSFTPAGTNATVSFTPSGTVAWPAGVPTNATSTIPGETFTGSALSGHTHTLTATGTNGTSSVTGTLSSLDNRSAFVKVIFCTKS